MDSSPTLSLSDAIKKTSHDMLYSTLINNPEKRAKVLELLTQEGIVRRNENSCPNSPRTHNYLSPVKRLQKNENTSKNSPMKINSVMLESPSALGRRKALQRLESDSSNDDTVQKIPNSSYQGTPKPFDKLLEGVIAYCEIRKDGEDRSATIKAMMQSMGAIVKDTLCRGVTHVILKDSLYTTYRKAKLLKVHVVSVLWLEAVRKHKYIVPESKFPAVCADAYEADITKICEEIQKDYEDVIQDELNNTRDNRRSETPLKFVTERKKFLKSRKTTYENSSYKGAHNRTELASPYKQKYNNPDLSDSDSYISVGSNQKELDIVPSSQNESTYTSINHSKSPQQIRISKKDLNEFEESNLGKIVRDSFELKKASKIRSPESLMQRSKQTNINNCNSLTDEESLKLRISTDDSNLNSTGNKSKSSLINLLENVTFDDTKSKSSMINNKEDISMNLPKESTSKNINQQTNIDTPSNGSLPTSTKKNNKNNSKRRTTVGLKRPPRNSVQDSNLNENPENITKIKSVSKNLKKTSESTLNSGETSDTLDNQNDKKSTRRKTLPKNNIDNNKNIPIKRARRKTLANSQLLETNSLENENTNVNQDEINKHLHEKSNKPDNTSSDSSTDKTKRRVRKLYDPNQVISESQIIWDEEPARHPTDPNNVSPSKNDKYKVPIKEVPKIFSAKAEKIIKRKLKNTGKSVAIKTKTEDKIRKSLRALNFDSTSSENSDREIQPKPPQTPSRRSVRLMQTPVKKIAYEDSTDPEVESKVSSDSDTTDNIVKTPRKTKRILSSHESDSSDVTPKSKRRTMNTPNMRTQLLKNKIMKDSSSDEQTKKDEESKRRSTLDFIQQKELIQKTKQSIKVPSIVCTKLQKSDVQVFQQIVMKLGGFIVEDEVSKRTTHVIAASPARTINMLRAIARGCWVLRHEWLYKSLEAGKWLEEEDYEMVEFSPSVQKCRLEKQTFGSLYNMDVFNSCGTIYISRSSTPRFSDLEELVKLCGGRIIRTPTDAQIVVAEFASHDGVICVNEKWILDSITHYKMKTYKAYVLEAPKSPSL